MYIYNNSIKNLIDLFHKKQVLTLNEIKIVLKTNSRMTIHRKLSSIDYKSSYSHKGKYYTLESIVKYNRTGLWNFKGIRFSKYGTLSKTIEYLINNSDNGYFASELYKTLDVFVHNELLKLFHNQKIQREQIGREFLYISNTIGEVQLQKRKKQIQESFKKEKGSLKLDYNTSHVECLKALLSVLNEKQLRLILGYESLRIGYGGDAFMSKLTGIDARTIGKGRKELLFHNILPDRIRSKGGGRPSVKKN